MIIIIISSPFESEDWDGYDNEFVIGNEKFPFMVAGYVQIMNDIPEGDGNVNFTGVINTVSTWPDGVNFAEVNAKIGPNKLVRGPLFNQDGILAISDRLKKDFTVYVGLTNPDGTFEISMPPGLYTITWFDIAQLYILQIMTFEIPEDVVEVSPAEPLFLTGWYTEINGFFFLDDDGNGQMDDGEDGLSHGPFPVLRLRDSTQIDRGFQFEVPFSDPERLGFYSFHKTYPLTSWMTLHAFHPLYEMTGYTFQYENQDFNTTVLVGTDDKLVGTADKEKGHKNQEYSISFFGSAGIYTRLDVGFKLKNRTTSEVGSIVGGVHYDTTRTNLNANHAMVENHEPGLPGIEIKLYSLGPLGTNGGNGNCKGSCDLNKTLVGYTCKGEGDTKQGESMKCTRFWAGAEGETKPRPIVLWAHNITGELDLTQDKSKPVLNTTTAEYERPKGCKITDHEGNAIPFGNCSKCQQVLPDGDQVSCIETPLLRNQIGNFAKTDGSFQFDNLQPGYYAIQMIIPMDLSGTNPMYKVRTENDVNTYESDLWQGSYSDTWPNFTMPPACPAADDACPYAIDPTQPDPPSIQNIKDPCAGAYITVDNNGDLMAYNPSFAENGGSHAAGNSKTHKCDIKVVRVESGVNSQVNFHLFTDVSVLSLLHVEVISFSHLMLFLQVPIPSRWKGLVLDDLLPQANPKATLFLELIGVPHIPVRITDYTGTELTVIETDVSNNSTLSANTFFPPSDSPCSIHSPCLGERLLGGPCPRQPQQRKCTKWFCNHGRSMVHDGKRWR